MSELNSQKFKLGNREISLNDLIDSDFLAILKSKYPSASEREFWISLRELVRYLHLTILAPHGLFFPGTKLMDDLWHSLITETKVYQNLCNNLRPGSFSLTATESVQGYVLSGSSMWVCGFEIFDKLLVGFETEDSVLFAIIDFPNAPSNELEITIHEMIALNGMGTINLRFDNYFVAKETIVSARKKTSTAPTPRQSQYIIPELGIAKKAIGEVKRLIENSKSPRHKLISEALPTLELRLKNIADLRDQNVAISDLLPLKDEVIRDAVRLLAVATGATVLLKGSLASRLQNEVMFLENPVQPASAIESRVRRICKGNI